MATAVRDVEKALGKVSFELTEIIKKSREFSRSLFVVKDIRKGESFTEENTRSIRPGFGLHPRYVIDILGKKATKDIGRGTPLSWDMVDCH